jgi:hypothetical protein
MRTAARVPASAALAALALGGTATATAAPPAFAGRQPTLTVAPSHPRPGSQVSLWLRGGCTAGRVTVTSAGLSGALHLRSDGGGAYSGSGRVSPHARPGRHHSVTIHCPGDGATTLPGFVVGHHPGKEAHAGQGGGIAGMDKATAAAGGVLLALAAAGSAVAVRRRNHA